jgi:hypothetical protein
MRYIVIATPRTGSTVRCAAIGEQNGIVNLAEFLAEKRWDIESDPPHLVATDNYRNRFRKLYFSDDWVLKLMPHHWLLHTHNALDQLINLAQYKEVLVRRDFSAQLRSFVAGAWLGSQRNLSWHSEFQEPILIPDTEHTRKIWQRSADILYNSIREQSLISSKYQIEITVLEDLHSYSAQSAYHRPIEFEKCYPFPYKNPVQEFFPQVFK